jgi:uncharacterized repeat protein (TIGR01451 family)
MPHRFFRAAAGALLLSSALAAVAAPRGATDTDLSVTVTDNRTTTVPGATLTYLIRVINQSKATVNGATVSDTFPANCVPTTWTCSGVAGAACPASGSGDVNASVDLPSGGLAVFAASCVVPAGEPPGSISNTATVAVPPGFNDVNPSNNSATDTTTLVGAPLLRMTKTAAGDFGQGGAMSYTLVISNTGLGNQGDNPGEELIDFLDPRLQLVSGTASSGALNLDTATGQVLWNGAVPAGASVTITLNATVRPDATGEIANVAVAFYDSDANGSNNAQVFSDDPSTPAPNDPTLFNVDIPTVVRAEMTASGGTRPLETVYYTVTLRNQGNAQADNPGDEFVNVLPASLALQAVQANSGSATADTATNTVRWNTGVPANSLTTMVIIAQVRFDTVGQVSNQGTVNYDGNGDGSNETSALSDDPGPPGDSDPTLINVLAQPTRIETTKTVYGDRYPPGGRFIYTISMSNFGTGQADNPGDEMIDILPPEVTLTDLSASSGTVAYDPATRQVTWNGAFPPFANVAVLVHVRVNDDASTTISNQAYIFYDSNGDGSNDVVTVSDDPSRPGATDPTDIAVLIALPGPGRIALLLLAATLLLLGARRLRAVARA